MTIENSRDGSAVRGSPGFRAGIALAVTIALAGTAIFGIGAAAYPWIKALHVIAIISWMAGLLYLPRLFIYHSEVPPDSAQSELFKVMERRLLTIIMTPAMVIAWVLGLWLAWTGGHFGSAWFHAKLLAVLALSAAHGYLSAAVRAFRENRNQVPTRRWRILNEVPAVLMIIIVVLAVVKPF